MILCYRPQPFLNVVTFLFLFSSSCFFPFSHGASDHFPAIQSPLPSVVVAYAPEVPYDGRRYVLAGPTGAPPLVEEDSYPSSSLVLAAKRTYRKDPLNEFKRYTGGWNIKDRHYWASVAYTALPLFAIAGIWFLGFGLILMLICLCYFCCHQREPYGYSKIAYALSLLLLIIFTIVAIIGCVVLYAGQGRFHASTTKTREYVVSQANTVAGKLKEVSDFLASAKQIAVDEVFLPANVQTDIDNIETKLNSSSNTLADKTVKNSSDIRDLVDSVRLALIVISAIMLVLTFLGFLFSVFGMQLLVYILVILGWILVTGTFILCGIFLLLHNVTGDTCVAMNEYVQNPTTHTALDNIIPCVDKATAQETLMRSREVASQLVDVINTVITNVSNINFAPNFVPMYFNQSGPLVPPLCNPFHHDLTDRPCSAGEVDMSNATQVWRNYVCEVSASGACTTTGRLTPSFYNQMGAAINMSYGLINYSPFLAELEDCTFVRETFSDIYTDYCPNLRNYSRWIYVGLGMVSTAVMLSLVFWVIYGRERHHRIVSKRLAQSVEAEENKDT